MFRMLLKRQFIEDILTYRFLISFVLILTAIVVFSLVFIGHYHGLQDVYSKAVTENDHNLSEFAKSPSANITYTQQSFLLKPRPELFIAESNESDFPQGFIFSAWEHTLRLLSPKEETTGAQLRRSVSKGEKITDVLTYSPDLTFIVQFFLSFFALVLAYDAVTAEKEKGTLRLIYSNPAKRAYFILAKYFSALGSMGLALLIGLMLSLILLNVLSPVPLSSSIIMSLSLFFLAAMVYLSTFILVGMSCSVCSHASKNSLVLCLLLWVFLVIVFPKSTGMLLTLKRYDVPTTEEINDTAQKARFETGDRLEKQLPPEYRADWEKYRLSEKILRLHFESDKSQQDILDFYLRKKLAAIEETRKLNYFSPASLFEYTAASVTGTGLSHFENLWRQVQRYEDDFTTFIKNESSVLEKGAFFYLDDNTISNKPVDLNGIPRFDDKNPAASERLKDALPYIGLLALYNLFLFAFVFYKFRTYDVR
jgi:ABC-type transport system involved in multi-copper enzyme maturation permease subunit